jgi:hypothetical protein
MSLPDKKEKCPDCLECQMCSKRRCQLCKKGADKNCLYELGPFITHGEFLEWKRKKESILYSSDKK